MWPGKWCTYEAGGGNSVSLKLFAPFHFSGAEDMHAYVWDRYYGICLAKYQHTDVVNSVAFNPRDSEMLVTTSDDYTIKVISYVDHTPPFPNLSYLKLIVFFRFRFGDQLNEHVS